MMAGRGGGLPSACLATILLFGTMGALPRTKSESKLVLRLLIPEPHSCLGSENVPTEIAIRNIGEEQLTIPLPWAGSGVHYRAFSAGDLHSPGLRTLDIRGDPWITDSRHPMPIILAAGQTSWNSGGIVLDRQFFSSSGTYAVSIDFVASKSNPEAGTFTGVLESNWAYFELEDCGSEKSKQ